jgi:hypothetical protein
LPFDVGPDVFALLEVGSDNDLGFERRSGRVTQGPQDFDARQIGEHQVQQDDVVAVGLGGPQGFLTIADQGELLAGFAEGPAVQFTDEMLIFDTEHFSAGGRRSGA